MMKGILFEDLYMYTNKYWKDVKSRHVRPTTKTLADIAQASPETYNKVKADLVPFPGDHAVEQLGSAFNITNSIGNGGAQPDPTYANLNKSFIQF